MTKKLNFLEMENLQGGYCNTVEFWETIADILALREQYTADGNNGSYWRSNETWDSWYQYNQLYLSIWNGCQ